MSDMHSLDLALLGVIAVSAVLAYLRGFMRTVFAVASWIGAGVIAWYAFVPLSVALSGYIQPALLARIAAGAGGFLAPLVLLWLVTGWIAGLVKQSGLGALDRALGLLLGILLGAVVVCTVYAVGSRVVPPPEQPSWVRSARSIPFIEAGVRQLEALLPERLRNYGATEAERLQRQLERIEEGQRLYKKMERPAAEPEAAAQTPTQGYKNRDRHDLNRLIDGAR